ncbi:hypothetical protein [Weissella cibaria]|uniref:hypothetical protein n=1 Tax=Weissella cibaria TaxID=137591 RepID=UPI00189A3F54|nr:hypothetical protein [Weissella cibaria]
MNVEQILKTKLPELKIEVAPSTNISDRVETKSGLFGKALSKAAKLADQAIDGIGSVSIAKIYVAPEIPDGKLDAAIKKFAPNELSNNIIGIIENSLVSAGSGMSAGIVFFGDRLFFKGELEEANEILYRDLKGISYDADSESVDLSTEVQSYTIEATLLTNINKEKFVAMLENIVTLAEQGAEFKQKDQTKPLESMDDSIKIAYVKLMVNYALSDDKKISGDEYAEIMSFVSRIQLPVEARTQIRGYLSGETTDSTEELMTQLEVEVPSGSFDIVRKSILKDLLVLLDVNGDLQSWHDDDFISAFKVKEQITDDQVTFIVDSIQKNKDILAKRMTDTQIEKSLKDLVAKGAAVGVPMLAVYFSGTVGVSAVGMTTGLATLGLGGIGVLGLSSMFTGIGAMALLGVGSYAAVKKFVGQKEVENNKQRELMLQEIIKNSQRTLNFLVEDIQYITGRLNEALKDTAVNGAKIKKLAAELSQYVSGAKSVSSKLDDAEKEAEIANLPMELDIPRLDELTKQASRKSVRSFVNSMYPDGKLNIDESLDKLRTLNTIFEKIGYFKLATATGAKLSGIAKQAFATGGKEDEQ